MVKQFWSLHSASCLEEFLAFRHSRRALDFFLVSSSRLSEVFLRSCKSLPTWCLLCLWCMWSLCEQILTTLRKETPLVLHILWEKCIDKLSVRTRTLTFRSHNTLYTSFQQCSLMLWPWTCWSLSFPTHTIESPWRKKLPIPNKSWSYSFKLNRWWSGIRLERRTKRSKISPQLNSTRSKRSTRTHASCTFLLTHRMMMLSAAVAKCGKARFASWESKSLTFSNRSKILVVKLILVRRTLTTSLQKFESRYQRSRTSRRERQTKWSTTWCSGSMRSIKKLSRRSTK